MYKIFLAFSDVPINLHQNNRSTTGRRVHAGNTVYSGVAIANEDGMINIYVRVSACTHLPRPNRE